MMLKMLCGYDGMRLLGLVSIAFIKSVGLSAVLWVKVLSGSFCIFVRLRKCVLLKNAGKCRAIGVM